MKDIMKHKINPRIDCVFKSLLGSEKNKLALLDFLNSILQPKQAIESVEFINPFNDKEFLSDKLTVVDIKAQDKLKQVYQIEIQIANHAYLPQRMIYTWSNIYSTQLTSGDNYQRLAPVISIWLLAENLFKDSPTHHHQFQLRDQQHQRTLSGHCSIHILELNKWQKNTPLTHADHWVYFFKEAHNWLELPSELNNPAMRQAMDTLRKFSEKEREYDRYIRRELFLHDQATWKLIKEDAEKETKALQQQAKESQQNAKESQQNAKESQQKAKESQQQAKELQQQTIELKQQIKESEQEMKKSRQRAKDFKQQAKENERLLALLREAGIEPGE